jgi:CheY-like chemotaxis protein
MDVRADAGPGLYTWLEVSDTGGGMGAATRSKIFDPFFTTKFTGRGLGLAAVLGIVHGHRAALRVLSEVGRGTSFMVFFPVSEAPAPTAAEKAQSLSGWTSRGTVLVVDDEAGVRTLARRILVQAGFDVLLAADGEEALRIAGERPDLRLVLLDMTMPHMSGEETFRRLRQTRPGLRVILSSGYDTQDATSRFVGKGLAAFLPKPYHPDQFIEVIRSVLEK